jgi:hypothetical protein
VDDLALKFNRDDIKINSLLPDHWIVELNDKALLKAVS